MCNSGPAKFFIDFVWFINGSASVLCYGNIEYEFCECVFPLNAFFELGVNPTIHADVTFSKLRCVNKTVLWEGGYLENVIPIYKIYFLSTCC